MNPAKRARAEETGSINLTFQDTAAHVATLPVGWPDVLDADQQEVLRIMVQFSREIEPNNTKKKWSVRPITGPGGVVTSYAASFAGYAGVIRVDALETFRLKFAANISYIGIDLTFVTADRAHSGAIVLCIPSQTTVSQAVHRHDLHGATAFDGVPAVAIPTVVSAVSAATTTMPTIQAAPPVAVPAAAVATVRPNGTSPSAPITPRGRGIWGTIASIAGLGDGADSGDER